MSCTRTLRTRLTPRSVPLGVYYLDYCYTNDGLTVQQVQSLPMMLRALADENMRMDLPDSDEAKQVCVKISLPIQLTGGHPCCLRNLFEAIELV